MANAKKSRAQILKKIPNYTKNVAKSSLFSSMDIIKQIAPEVGEFTESSSRLTQSAISEGRKYSTNFTSFFKNYKNTQIYKEIQQAKKEAIEDLKSGKFYNKEREIAKNNAALAMDDKNMLADMGIDFDDSEGELSDEEIIKKMMGESSGTSNSTSDGGDTPTVVINNLSTQSPSSSISAIGSCAKMTSNTILNSSQYIVDNQNALFSMQSVTSHKMFSEVSERLQEMSGYLKGLFDYTGNISNFFTASMEYYDKTVTAYDAMQAAQKELNELTRTIGGLNTSDESNLSDEITHDDVFRNGLDLSSYFNKVKENAKSNTGLVGSMFDYMKTSAEQTNQSWTSMLLDTMNPAKLLSKGIAKKFIVNPIEDSLKDFNITFKSFFKGLSLKGKKMSEKSPVMEILYNLLGVSPDDEKSINLGSNGNPISYNDYANRSIIEVMPTYLRKIASALTGEPEYVYDYTTGKFRTLSTVKKNFDTEERIARDSSTFNYRYQADDAMEALGLSSKQRKDLNGKYKDFLNFIADNEIFFNPHKDKYEDYSMKGINGIVDENEFEFFKKLILASKDQGIGLNDTVYDSRADYNNFITRKNKEMIKTGESSIFNGYDETRASKKGGLLLNTLNVKDTKGSSIYDYLFDIRSILLEGIFVYSVSTKSGTIPHAKPEERLEDYKNRVEKSKAKYTSVSNSGKETYGEDYISVAEKQDMNNKMMTTPEDILAAMQKNKASNKKNELEKEDKEIKSSSKGLIDNIKSITDIPMQIVNTGIKSLDARMKQILYGKDSIANNFIDQLKETIQLKFTGFQESLNMKIIDPLQEKLFGKEGIMTKFDSWIRTRMDGFGEKAKNFLLGTRDENGSFKNGAISGLANYGLDTLNHIKRFATGNGFKSAVNGKEIKDLEGGSLFSYIKDGFNNMKDKFSEKLFGKVIETDENGKRIREGNGLIDTLKQKFFTTTDKMKTTLIGKTGVTGQDLKDSLPNILKGAGIGISTALYTSLFMPFGIGIIPGLLLGGVTGFAQSNEHFQNFLFGDGENDGVLGGRELKEKIDKYMPNMMKGFGIGAVAGLLTGNPILGPILGSAVGFATKSETFKEFLFGKDGDDSKALIKKETIQKIKEAFPKAAGIGATTFAYKSLGFLGSSLLPGGIIGTALFSFAGALALNSESVKKFLFGDIDLSTGKRDKTGVIGKLGVWFKYNFVEEIKFRLYDMSNSFKLWFREKIGNKLLDAFKPMYEEIKYAGKKIVGFFANSINKVFEKSVGVPLSEFMNKILLNPLKKIFGGFFRSMKKVIEFPFAVVGKAGNALAERHQRLGLEYTKDYFKNKAERDKGVIEDRNKFKAEKSDRREKLSFLQKVLKSNGYNIKNENVKNAMDDFDTKYKKGKWRDFEISTYKSVNVIETEEIKQTSLMEQIKGFTHTISDYINSKLKIGKDKIKDKTLVAKDKITNIYPDVVDGYDNVKGTLSSKFSNFKGSFKYTTSLWKNNIMSQISSSIQRGDSFINGKIKTTNIKSKESDIVDISKYKDSKNKIKEIKIPNAAQERRENIKSGKYNLKDPKENKKKNESNIASINRHVKAIDREIAGQLNGVGWNLDAIRKILAKYTHIDEKGNPLRRGNRKRSFFTRAKNFFMRPIDAIKDFFGGIKEKIVGGITSTLDTAKNIVIGGFKTIGGVLSTGASILKTTLKTLGIVIEEGAKVIGTLAIETTKVVGQVLVSGVQAVGSVLSGLVEGVGKLGGALLSSVGSLAKGIASATGSIISGVGKFTGSLFDASGKIIKGAVTFTKDLTKELYKDIKGLLKGAVNLIKAPFKFISNKFGKNKVTKVIRIDNLVSLLDSSRKNPMFVKVVNTDEIGMAVGSNLGGRSDYSLFTNHGPKPTPPTGGGNVIPVDFNKKKKIKPNEARINSMATKINTDANADVNSYADKISNIKNFNFVKASDDINKIKADGVVSSKAIVETAAASKGTFAFLAKQSKKGGFFSKLGTLLFMGLPAIMKFIKNLKSGKWIGTLVSKLFGKNSLIGRLGGLIIKGISTIGNTLKSIFNLFMKTKLGTSIAKGAGSILDKVLGKKKKIKLEDGSTITQRDGKLSNMGRSIFGKKRTVINENGEKIVKKDGIFSRAKDKLKEGIKIPGYGNAKLKNKKEDKNITGKITKSKKGDKLRSIGSTITEVAKGQISSNIGLPTNGLDLSSIDNMITINGNVLLNVNGSLLAGSQSLSDTSTGNSLLDIAKDKVEDKLSEKIGKRKSSNKKKGEIVDLEHVRSNKKGKIKRAENATHATVKLTEGKPHVKKGKGKLGAIVGGVTTGLTAASLFNSNDDQNPISTVGDLAIQTATDVATDTVANNVIDFASRKASMRGVVNGAEEVATGVGKKGMIAKLSSLVERICNSGFMQRIFGEHAGILPKVSKWVIGKLSKLGAKQLPKILSKLTTRLAGGIASLGIIPTAFAAYDGVSGMLEVRKIFKLSPNAPVTMGMRLATGLAKAVSNNLTFGFIDSSDIANFIYGLVASTEDKMKLQNSQNDFKSQYNQYAINAQNKGEKVKDFDSWNDDQNKGIFSKGLDYVTGAFKKVGSFFGLGGDDDDSSKSETTTSAVQGLVSNVMPILQTTQMVSGLFGRKKNSQLPSTDIDPSSVSITPIDALTSGNITNAMSGSNVVINGNATIRINGRLNSPLGSGLSPVGQDPLFSNITTNGQKVDLGTVGDTLKNDAGLLLSPTRRKLSMQDQFRTIDTIRSQADKLMEKSSTAAQLTMSKANDAIKNTASTYSNLASTTMNSTMNMATVNSTNNATAYTASGSANAAVPVGQPPAQVQSQSNSLWSTIKNVGSSIVNGVSKFFGFGGQGSDVSGTSTQSSTASTSNSGNVMHGMVYYNQNEDPWAKMPYNAKGQQGKTIKTSGCGPTSAAMVVSSITGKTVTPEEAAKWSVANGFRDPNNGTSWGFFNAFGKQYGIGFKQMGPNAKALVDALQAKQPVILSGAGAPPYTSGGHFVVAAGLDQQGNVLINDPNRRSRSTAYSPNALVSAGMLQMFVADKTISGNLPSGIGAATPGIPGSPQQQATNDPLGIISKIGSTLVDASSSIMMGKVYTGQPTPTEGESSGGVIGTGSYNGKMGTMPLSQGVLQYQNIFDSAGAKYGVEPAIMQAIAMQESGGNPNSNNGYALGLMQIENTLASEFAKFGRDTAGQSYSLADRADPSKAIPFATSRFSSDLKHYSGDYMKAIQAYNFSKYSLDALIKNVGGDWMARRREVGRYNGTGARDGGYGDPQYIEHVMRYYHGSAIKSIGGNGDGPIPPVIAMLMALNGGKIPDMGGNGEGNTIVKPELVKENTIGNTRKIINMGTIQKETPKPIDPSVKVDQFVTHNMRSVSDRIDNLLFAKESIENGKSSMDLKAILTVLNQISANTAETANNTEKIAEKDFEVTHKYENTFETTQNIDKSTNNTQLNHSSNPFISSAQQSVAPTSGYEWARQIAAK